jgi:hypothetical protein
MDDRIRRILAGLLLRQKNKNSRRLQPARPCEIACGTSPVARPHISLKARMLGGQAETIMRPGGSMR